MALSDAEQKELLELCRQQSGYRRVSHSPLRHVGEGPTETATGFDLNVDGNVHVLLVNLLARLGDPDALTLLREVANADPARYPDRVHDRMLAQAILNDIAGTSTPSSAPPTGATPGVIPTPQPIPITPQPVTIPPASPPVPPAAPTVGPDGGVVSTIAAAVAEIDQLVQAAAEATHKIRS